MKTNKPRQSFPGLRLPFQCQRSLLAAACLLAIGLVAPSPSTAAPPATRTACLNATAEMAMRARDNRVLGNLHAEQHARMRAQQCEAERGIRRVPAKGRVVTPEKSLQDDSRVRAAALSRVQPSREVFDAALLAAADVAATEGRWSEPFHIPVKGVTSVLLHTGKLLFWSYNPDEYQQPSISGAGVAYVWNPATRTGNSLPPPENIWCAGQTILADGRVFLAGGNLAYPNPNDPVTGAWRGTLTSYTFDAQTEQFTRQPDMQHGRWYPTTTKLADGRVVITSGIDETGMNGITNVVEVFTPVTGAALGTIQAVGTHNPSGLYPFQFLLPGGRMLEAGPGASSSYRLDPATWQWDKLPDMLAPHYYLGSGISFTDLKGGTRQQTIMVGGGHTEAQPQSANEWLDGLNPTAGWKPFPQWQVPRHNHNTVILPDGTLLTVGGNRGLYGYDDAVFDTELYTKPPTDKTGSWIRLAPHAIQAAYHSSAILLPDATVLLSQDDMDHTAVGAEQHKVQIFQPPYLFKGPQPVITSVPANLTAGQNFDIETDRTDLASAILIAPGAVTHSNDMHQRAIRLNFRINKKRGWIATVPAAGLAPPGYYMLFVVDTNGIPSNAKFVKIG